MAKYSTQTWAIYMTEAFATPGRVENMQLDWRLANVLTNGFDMCFIVVDWLDNRNIIYDNDLPYNWIVA